MTGLIQRYRRVRAVVIAAAQSVVLARPDLAFDPTHDPYRPGCDADMGSVIDLFVAGEPDVIIAQLGIDADDPELLVLTASTDADVFEARCGYADAAATLARLAHDALRGYHDAA